MALKTKLFSPLQSETGRVTIKGPFSDIESIYAEYNSFVRRSLFWMVGPDALDDLVQECFVKVWQNLSRFSGQSSIKTWIYRIAMNTAIDHLRKQKRHWFLKTQQETVSVVPANDLELPQLIEKGIQQLPLKLRSAFVLFYKMELSVQEVGEALGLPEGTVKSRLFKSRQTFVRYLQESGVHYENP